MKSECLRLNHHNLLRTTFLDSFEPDVCDYIKSAKLVICSNGGYIAALDDSKKPEKVKIFYPNGRFFKTIKLSGRLVSMEWNNDNEEGLILLFSDGRLRFHCGDFFENFTEFSVLNEALDDESVIEAYFDKSLITILTSLNEFCQLSIATGKVSRFPRPNQLEYNSPQCWTVDEEGTVIFGQGSSIFTLTLSGEMCEKQLPYETVGFLSYLKENHSLVACTSDSHLITFSLPDFKVQIDCNFRNQVNFYQISQIGHFTPEIIAIFQSQNGQVDLLDSPSGQFLHMKIGNNFSWCKEIDGIRFISEDCGNVVIGMMPLEMVDLIFKKPEESRIGRFYEKYSNKKFEEILAITESERIGLIEACSESLLMLSYEPELQKSLKNGLDWLLKNTVTSELDQNEGFKHTITYIKARMNKFLGTIQALRRVQENLNFPMPLSPLEFQQGISPDQLFSRLVQVDQHCGAFEVALLLEVDLSPILMDWALKAIKEDTCDEGEEILFHQIADKIFTWGSQRAGKMNFIKLADFAMKMDRLKLARQILGLEKDIEGKFDLLVGLNDYRDVLIQCINSYDNEKVKYILNVLIRRLSLTEFIALTNISESVKSAIYRYCRDHEPAILQILLYQEDRLPELLELLLLNDNSANTIGDLENLEKWFKLIRVQRCFEKRFGAIKLCGKTRIETLQLLSEEINSRASKEFCESIADQ